ncbi:MAG: hypothetical protein QW770_00450 [Candidatus Bathyarchaeia archaeon]
MGCLSQTQRLFIEGKITPSRRHQYVLIHRIRKKRQQMIEELYLIENFLRRLEEEKKQKRQKRVKKFD